MAATAAAARYVLDKGTLELSGADAGGALPHMDTARMGVEAPKLAITLDGPVVSASGGVRSVLKHEPADAPKSANETKMPSMLKKDRGRVRHGRLARLRRQQIAGKVQRRT